MSLRSGNMKGKKGTIIAAVLLILVCVGAGALYLRFRPSANVGSKNITVTVVRADSTEKEFRYQTDAEYLGKVLEDEQLVEGDQGQYGLFITVADGEQADDSKQQWWCLTKGGEMVNTSADQTPIADGDRYELTLKEGY